MNGMEKKDYNKEYREKNKEKIAENKKKWCEANKEKIKKRREEYKEINKEVISEKNKEYREKNKEKIKEYREKNKEKIKEYRKEYRKKNRDKINEYERNKRKVDELYWLKTKLRSTISDSLRYKGYTKNTKTFEILGCTFEELKVYLESKFEPWMNWENRGLYNGEPNYGWDIDHIIPLSIGNTMDEIIKLNHYTNLSPLCSFINRDVKKDNIIHTN
jgi:hypothetical protein